MNATDKDYEFCKSHLGTGERILWQGRSIPNPTAKFLIALGAIIYFSFFGFWVYRLILPLVTTPWSPWGLLYIFFCLPALFLIGVGIYFLIYLCSAINNPYVITERKIMRKRNGKVAILLIKELPDLDVQCRPDRSGSITFSQSTAYYYNASESTSSKNHMAGKLFSINNIPDVINVSLLIEEARAALRN